MIIWNVAADNERKAMNKKLTQYQLKKLSINAQLPIKTKKKHSIVLDIVKQRGDIVAGSFAQKILYPEARKYKDIDIISVNPLMTAKEIQKRTGGRVVKGRGNNYIIKSDSGKTYADVVSTEFYKKYKQKGQIPYRDINGLHVINEDILFQSRKDAALHSKRLRQKMFQDLDYLSS